MNGKGIQKLPKFTTQTLSVKRGTYNTKVFYLKTIDTYIITVVNLNNKDVEVFEMMGAVSDWITKNDKQED